MKEYVAVLNKFMAFTAVLLVIIGCTKAEEKETRPGMKSKKILARVDGDPVYEDEVIRRVMVSHNVADKSTVDPDQWENMINAALESEIFDMLLLNAAVSEGMAGDQEGVSHLIDRSKTMLGEERFQEMLKKRNSTEEEYRQFLGKRSLIKQYKEKLIAGISIDEDELKRFYEGHQQSFTSPESGVIAFEEAKERIRNIMLQGRQQEILNDWAESAKQKARIEYSR